MKLNTPPGRFVHCAVVATLMAIVIGLQAQSTTNGLLVYLNFDNNLNAQGGTTNNGAIYGNPAGAVERYVISQIGQAASFDNTGNAGQPTDWAVTLGSLERIYSNNFSFSLWEQTGSTLNGAIFGNKNWTSGNNVGWSLNTTTINWNAAGGTRRDINLSANLDGNWHLITVTWNRTTTNQVLVYKDGVLFASSTLSPSNSAPLNAGFPTLVGSSGNGTDSGSANIDDLGVWNRILTPTEVAAIYLKGTRGAALNGASVYEFTAQPQGGTRYVGENFVMSCSVADDRGAVSYQWQLGGSALPSATNSTLILTNLTTANAGTYTVVVTDPQGSITSTPAVLVVSPVSNVANGLTGYWNFDETSGVTAADSSPNANSGILYNFPGDSTTWVSGKIGKALNFGGPAYNQIVTVNSFVQPTNTFTISAWVWAKTELGNDTILDNYGQTGIGQCRFGLNSASKLASTVVPQGAAALTSTDASVLPARTWQHVALVADGMTVRLYRNGNQVASGSYNGTVANPSAVANMFFGARIADDGVNLNTTPGYWTGLLDDLGMWNRALTPNEILSICAHGVLGQPLTTATADAVKPFVVNPPRNLSLFVGETARFLVEAASSAPLNYQWYQDNTLLSGATNASLVLSRLATTNAGSYTVTVSNSLGSATSAPAVLAVQTVTGITNGLAVYLNFDGNILAQSGTTNNGTAIGIAGQEVYTNGIIGSAASFNNDASVYLVPSDWAVSLGNIEWIYAGNWSFSLWVNTTSTLNGALLGNKDWRSGVNTGWLFSPKNNNVVLNYYADGGPRRDLGTVSVLGGKWHHVTCVFDRDSNLVSVYVDGQFNTSASLSATGLESLTPAAIQTTLVGGSGNGAEDGAGSIDDLGIWNRSLTTSEILSIYAQGIKGQPLTTAVAGSAVRPFFVALPQSQSLFAGQTAKLMVTAGGSTPLAYQWCKDKSPLPGATNDTLVLDQIATSNAGSYTVVVANSLGSVTSTPPAIVTVRPVNSVVDGMAVYLNFDGNILAQGGTTNSGTAIGMAGQEVYTNGVIGSAASFNNDGTVNLVPSDWAVSLGNIEWIYGGDWSFSLWVNTTSTLNGGLLGNKDWRSGVNTGWIFSPKNNNVVLNYYAAGGPRRDLGTVSVLDGKWHQVTCVFNRGNNLVSVYVDGQFNTSASLSATGLESLTPADVQTTLVGGSGNGAEAGAGSIDDLGIWTRPLTASEIFSIYAQGIKSQPLTTAVTGDVKPFIVTSPQSLTRAEGHPASLSVAAVGTAPLSYQWLKDGVDLSGQTNSTLSFVAALGDAGSYTVVVRNSAGAITSSPPALLTVTSPPVLLTNGLAVYLDFESNILGQGGTAINGTAIGNIGKEIFTNGVVGAYAALFANDGSDAAAPSDWAVSLGDIEWVYTNNWSFSLWMDTTNKGDTALFGNKDWTSGANTGWALDTTRLSGLNYVAAGEGRRDLGSIEMRDGQWHHVAAVFYRDANQVYVYVDGVLSGQATIGTTGMESLTPTSFAPNVTLIGGSGTGVDSGSGAMDDLCIWTRPLSQAEVVGLYQAGANGVGVLGATAGAPPLQAVADGTNVALVFPAWARDYTIQSSSSLLPGSWKSVTAAPSLESSGNVMVVLPMSPGAQFFRLQH